MVDRSVYSAENCSLARTLAVVGEKWTLLILREVQRR
jgi:DNA-binding HxlR family transcriptional regulator